jgi:hypothetical protein
VSESFSSRTTDTPRRARWYATEAPADPPPTTTTSASAGSALLQTRNARNQQVKWVGVSWENSVHLSPLFGRETCADTDKPENPRRVYAIAGLARRCGLSACGCRPKQPATAATFYVRNWENVTANLMPRHTDLMCRLNMSKRGSVQAATIASIK